MSPKLSDFHLNRHAGVNTTTRGTSLSTAAALKLATGPYMASRAAAAAAAATSTKSLYE
jgi:hypothetical protein